MWHKVTMIIFTFIIVNVHWHRIKYFVVLFLSLLLVDLHRNMCFTCLVLLMDLHRYMYSHSKSCVCAKHVPFTDKCSIEPKWIYILIYFVAIYMDPFMGKKQHVRFIGKCALTQQILFHVPYIFHLWAGQVCIDTANNMFHVPYINLALTQVYVLNQNEYIITCSIHVINIST